MIPHNHKRAVKVLPVLLALWILQGCAQVSTQSRPVDAGRPSEVEAPSPGAPEAPAVPESPVSVTPEEIPPRAEVSAASGPEIPAAAEPGTSVAPEEIPIRAWAPKSVQLEEAPAQVASLAPVRREVAARVKPLPIKSKPTPYVHVVRWKGETLSLIAQWYTASWKNWEVIARANPGIDSDRITIGNRIRVPKSLLKRRTPMPFEIIPPSPGRTRQKSTAGEPRAHAEEVVLFGPTEAIELFEPEEIAGKPAEIPEESGLFGPIE